MPHQCTWTEALLVGKASIAVRHSCLDCKQRQKGVLDSSLHQVQPSIQLWLDPTHPHYIVTVHAMLFIEALPPTTYMAARHADPSTAAG